MFIHIPLGQETGKELLLHQDNTRLRQMDTQAEEVQQLRSVAQKQPSSHIQTLRSSLPDLQHRQPNTLARTPLPKAHPMGTL